jgi:hypothetical protein
MTDRREVSVVGGDQAGLAIGHERAVEKHVTASVSKLDLPPATEDH